MKVEKTGNMGRRKKERKKSDEAGIACIYNLFFNICQVWVVNVKYRCWKSLFSIPFSCFEVFHFKIFFCFFIVESVLSIYKIFQPKYMLFSAAPFKKLNRISILKRAVIIIKLNMQEHM